jgi:putative copper export protein
MLARTVWGWGWLLQLGAALAAAAAFALARRGTGAGWAAAALAALGLAFTPALAGHAAAAPRLTALAVLSDGLHVLGAGGWLGSLVVVLGAGVPAALALGPGRRGAAVAALVDAFSPTALACAGLTAGTGLLAAWLHVGRLAALWGTGYGRTLLVKLAVLSLVAGTGAYNWRRVRPALGDDAGTARLRRSAAAELAVGALVLLATAVLVATPTPVDGPGDAQPAAVAAGSE